MKICFPFFSFICFVTLGLSAIAKGPGNVQFVKQDKGGMKLKSAQKSIDSSQNTLKSLEQKYRVADKKTFDQALEQRQLHEKKYSERIKDKSQIKTPRRVHSDGTFMHRNNKKRLLRSANNQYEFIDEGNSNLVTDGQYIYTFASQYLKVFKLVNQKMSQVSQIKIEWPLIFVQMHVSQNYLALIFQEYRPNTTIIKVYHNDGQKLLFVRQYSKQGYYIQSREYNSEILVFVLQQMKSITLDYTWTISDIGEVNQTKFQGVSGNKTSNNLGNAVRSFAKIPLGPIQNKNYQFTTFLFCDFAWDMVLTQGLKVIVPGNYYNSSDYAVTFQYFDFNPSKNITWGTSKWVRLPGLFYSNYQIHQFNNYLRVVLLHSQGVEATSAYVSIAKIPLPSFDPAQGSLYHNLGIQNVQFVSCRFRRDLVFLLFRDGTIKSFSTSFGLISGTLKLNYTILHLYPYGPKYLIGMGTTNSTFDVALVTFYIDGYRLIFQQSITINGPNPTFYTYGWFSNQFLQFDWQNKRVTFPLFIAQDQPYRSGFYHLYVNPQEKCLSSFPVSNPCQNKQNNSASLNKIVKHWDDSQGYNWNTGPSEEISRSATIFTDNKSVLITFSSCQLQSRILKSTSQSLSSSLDQNKDEFSFVDLCTSE